ncbi:unnamed protein product [Urochloa humidicola]
MSSAGDSNKGGMGGMNMVTTVMAFSVSAFFVLFVFTRLLCARLHLSRAAAAADRAAAGAFVVSVERGIHGLEPSVVTAFPTVKLGDGAPQQRPPPVQEESQCTVCLEEYEAKDVVRVLPACGHAFHAPCIDAWLRQHPTCPVCRASLRVKAGAAANNRATPLDHRRLVTGGAAPAASSQQVPASSSSDTTASPEAAAVADGRLEIITEELGDDRSPATAAAAAGGGGGGSHSPCGDETAGQSGRSGAGASEHC